MEAIISVAKNLTEVDRVLTRWTSCPFYSVLFDNCQRVTTVDLSLALPELQGKARQLYVEAHVQPVYDLYDTSGTS